MPVAPPVQAQKTLWTGAVYMQDGQTVNLSEAISAQPNGIILAWSAYEGGVAVNYDWNYTTIPKRHVARSAGAGVDCVLMRGTTVIRKYVYVSDSSLAGFAANSTAPNNGIVLREVIAY